MVSDNSQPLDGCILEEEFEVSLGELCGACAVHAEYIMALVDEGILEPAGQGTGAWRFAGTCLQRTHMALHLERDLGINLAGVALVLDLMDEIRRLQASLNRIS